MSRLAREISTRITVVIALLVVALMTVCAAGIHGLQQTADLADSIYADHLATIALTVDTATALDDMYRMAATLAVEADQAGQSASTARLYDQVPGFEVSLDRLLTAHAGDDAAELSVLHSVEDAWSRTKSTVLAELTVEKQARPSEIDVQAAFEPLVAQVRALVERERRDADRARLDARSEYTWSRSTILVITVASLVIGTLALVVLVRRVIPRALSLGEGQARFGEAITLAEDEPDAHDFLRRHLERVVAGGSSIVLRRNNSANRLEAIWSVDPTVGPVLRLDDAEPRSCVAVRTARPHRQTSGDHELLSCRVCGGCPGTSLCTPLTVGGEVIGAVLVNSAHAIDDDDERQIHATVAQAAPVLANLRNLAVAEFRAATDSLTGLPNRRALTDTVRRLLANADRAGRPLALLSLDLDHFKQINDRFGHPIGDQVLASVGAALRANLRPDDFAGRYGGEEFLILLPDTSVDEALQIAGRIHHLVNQIIVPAIDLHVTVSIGIAVYPDHAKDVESLQRGADRALYDAKNNGRNRTAICTHAPSADHASPTLDHADGGPPADLVSDSLRIAGPTGANGERATGMR